VKTRLLLVEDDERIRQALGLALADEGCDVAEAESGERALRVPATTPVDVVLLDLVLPGVDGFEVCRTLRSRGDLPIIIVSARTDSADAIEGLDNRLIPRVSTSFSIRRVETPRR
jgi:two-component system response regulator MtrA